MTWWTPATGRPISEHVALAESVLLWPALSSSLLKCHWLQLELNLLSDADTMPLPEGMSWQTTADYCE